MKKRYFKPRDKSLPKNYDSKLELRLHEGPLKGTQHHVPKEDLLPYTTSHTYEPDYIFTHNDTLFICEAKGRYVDSQAASKLLSVREHMIDWKVFKESGCTEIELILIFENAATPMPHARKRKNGTKLSHGEHATKNGFRWLCEKRGDLQDVATRTDLIKKLEELN